jgi:hypothetical protein
MAPWLRSFSAPFRTCVKKPGADRSAGKTTTLKDMKNVAGTLLGICILLTILLIKEDRAVPGHYTGWGAPNMTKVAMVLAARWVVMTAAFIAMLASGRLNGWAPWAFLRVVLALGGVFALEFSSFVLHSVFADEQVLPRYRMLFAVLATALPLCVTAGGFLSLRWLFLIGVGASMIGGMYGSAGETTFMKIKRPFLPASNPNETVDYVLLWANPMYEPNQLQEVFARIEQRPGWIGEVTQQLDGQRHLSAMYVLCRQPTRLDKALQERCWTAVGAATVELDQQFQKEGHVTTSEALKLVETVKGLAALPGPVRDRHRGEFLAAVEYLNRARADASQIPDMGKLDWAGK